MFCTSCSAQLPDGIKFCMNCGTAISKLNVNEENASDTKTKLIPAKCTNYGANIKVDASQRSAICPFCNSAYIVEQAINDYNINVSGNLNVENATINVIGIDANNLLLRARKCEDAYEYELALDYYNQIQILILKIRKHLRGVNELKRL